MLHVGVVARLAALSIAGTAALVLAGSASAATNHRIVRPAPMTALRGGQGAPMIPLPGVRPRKPAGSRNDVVTSTNWSGYATESGSKFTYVTGTWTQPSVTCSSRSAQYASFWAGIDGYSSDSVEQLGTDSDCTGKNSPSYYAWYEMYPANSVDISTSTYPVKPGDTMTASVSVSGTSFTLKLTDSTKGWTFSTTQSGSGLSQSSAELIAESPEICSVRCKLAQLADFGTVNFSNAQAAVSGGSAEPFSSFTSDSGPHEIVMDTSNGTVRAQPSALNNGEAFSIAWEHD
jgi:hypothetical protein